MSSRRTTFLNVMNTGAAYVSSFSENFEILIGGNLFRIIYSFFIRGVHGSSTPIKGAIFFRIFGWVESNFFNATDFSSQHRLTIIQAASSTSFRRFNSFNRYQASTPIFNRVVRQFGHGIRIHFFFMNVSFYTSFIGVRANVSWFFRLISSGFRLKPN